MHFRWSGILITLASIGAPIGHAQQPVTTTQPGRRPRAIVGTVADTAGRAIDSAEVILASPNRRTVTGADGRFEFDDVKPGNYELVARKLGFYPQTRRVKVDTGGGAIKFELVQRPYSLAPVVSTATRLGLSGVVGDTAYNIVSGAAIAVLAGNERAVSDSTGAFFLGLKPGRHVLRVSRDGFAPRMLTVTIPPDSGRRVVVWLTPANRAGGYRESFAMDSLAHRLLVRNPVWSKLLTREDILRSGVTDVPQLATVGAGKRIDQRCPAIVDGGPMRLPLWAFEPADIEMMEVYTTPPPRRTNADAVAQVFKRRPPDTRGWQPDTMSTSDCGAQLYVWLRK
ncbi:MAG TPA: carboxypeptidase-like regulatory domain-containing protein [Gemmatimonadaceae bacterium]|nr:carboxypeptidase-like regulatory domain-containing protein [Gemmatimonadaceae bacterium]